MKKYNVLGNTSVTVCVTVEADSEQDIDKFQLIKKVGVLPKVRIRLSALQEEMDKLKNKSSK